jgi:putative flippase GtrA
MNSVRRIDYKQMGRYICGGICATLTDLITYSLLLHHCWPSIAKGISFVAASCVAYVIQKFWTFKQQKHSWAEMARFGSVYGVSLLANVTINKLVISISHSVITELANYQYQLGWLCATGTSVVLNYVGQKFWVFRISHHQTAEPHPES